MFVYFPQLKWYKHVYVLITYISSLQMSLFLCLQPAVWDVPQVSLSQIHAQHLPIANAQVNMKQVIIPGSL